MPSHVDDLLMIPVDWNHWMQTNVLVKV